MRLHLILPFMGWLFRKSFSGVIRIHQQYQRQMDDTPALMLFIGTILSVLFTALTTLTMTVILGRPGLIEVFYTAAFASLSYVVLSFVSMLFDNFKEERRELFETIKKS